MRGRVAHRNEGGVYGGTAHDKREQGRGSTATHGMGQQAESEG